MVGVEPINGRHLRALQHGQLQNGRRGLSPNIRKCMGNDTAIPYKLVLSNVKYCPSSAP